MRGTAKNQVGLHLGQDRRSCADPAIVTVKPRDRRVVRTPRSAMCASAGTRSIFPPARGSRPAAIAAGSAFTLRCVSSTPLGGRSSRTCRSASARRRARPPPGASKSKSRPSPRAPRASWSPPSPSTTIMLERPVALLHAPRTVEELLLDDRHLRRGVLARRRRSARARGVVDRERGCAQVHRGRVRNAELRPVGEHDRDGVALLDAERRQSRGDPATRSRTSLKLSSSAVALRRGWRGRRRAARRSSGNALTRF